jgi:hypothetical protein
MLVLIILVVSVYLIAVAIIDDVARKALNRRLVRIFLFCGGVCGLAIVLLFARHW